MESNFDFEQAQRFMDHFAKAGEGVSEQVVAMSHALNEARGRAEASAQMVSERAELLQSRKEQVNSKMQEFRILGEQVRDLTVSLADLKRPEGSSEPNEEERGRLAMRLSEVEIQIRPLIEKARALKKDAQSSKMKVLEQSADSLGQSLQAISQKLSVFQQADQKH